MVVFIIPVRHPLNTNKLERAEYFLKLTLSSILSQTLKRFKIIVVCNDVPHINMNSNKIDFHVVNFPPPCLEKRANIPLQSGVKDKGAKLISGFMRSLKYNPDYVFFVDSDDWVNINLVDFLLSKSISLTWYVDAGYFVDFPNKRFKKKHGLIRYCGSTWIYDPNFLFDILNTNSIDEKSSKEEIFQNCSNINFEIFSGHQRQWFYFHNDLNIKPRKIPFSSICWVIGTGENHSSIEGNNIGLPINKSFCKLFGLPDSLSSNEFLSLTALSREYIGRLYSKFTWYRSVLLNKYFF